MPRRCRPLDQLNLFHPRPRIPRWQVLPPKVQRRVTRLLSQILQKVAQDLVRSEREAVRDE